MLTSMVEMLVVDALDPAVLLVLSREEDGVLEERLPGVGELDERD